jgi:hypothetical protein
LEEIGMAVRLIFLHPVNRAGVRWETLLLKTNPRKFDESSVFGADLHEMYHIARMLVASHTFHQDWPYRDQVKTALAACYHFPQ